MLDLPLERIHPLAFRAAEATACAAEQGKFWQMHDRLFANSKSLDNLSPHAEAIGLDLGSFTDCLQSGRAAASVRKDMEEAAKAGATGTPAFLLALTDPADPSKVEGLTTFRGAQPFNAFRSQIERALRDLGKAAAQPRREGAAIQ